MFASTLALSSNRTAKALSHMIYSTLVLACILYILVGVWIWKLKPSRDLSVRPSEKIDLSLHFDTGSSSTTTSIISLRRNSVKSSVGFLAYLNTNYAKSITQYLSCQDFESMMPSDFVSFLRYPCSTFLPLYGIPILIPSITKSINLHFDLPCLIRWIFFKY